MALLDDGTNGGGRRKRRDEVVVHRASIGAKANKLRIGIRMDLTETDVL